MKVAVIGLGRMGEPIAGHVADAGHDVSVFDVDGDAVRRWADTHDGTIAATVADAARNADVIISSLPADPQVLEVSEQVLSAIGAGAVWIDHSTTSVTTPRQLSAAFADKGAYFLDAPVSGGVDGARNGSLTVMIGGDTRAVAAAGAVLNCYSGRITHMGDSGAGQITKMTNQICVLGLCQALAEGLVFAETAGLDPNKVVHVMTQGSSTSWEMEHRSAQMIAAEYDFGFSTTLMSKDAGLVLEFARELSLPLPVTEMVAEFLADVTSLGGGSWDWCALMERQRSVAANAAEF